MGEEKGTTSGPINRARENFPGISSQALAVTCLVSCLPKKGFSINQQWNCGSRRNRYTNGTQDTKPQRNTEPWVIKGTPGGKKHSVRYEWAGRLENMQLPSLLLPRPLKLAMIK